MGKCPVQIRLQGHPFGKRDFLRQVSDTVPRWQRKGTAVDGFNPGEQPEEGRFARSVHAHKRNALTCVNLEPDVGEDVLGAIGTREI